MTMGRSSWFFELAAENSGGFSASESGEPQARTTHLCCSCRKLAQKFTTSAPTRTAQANETLRPARLILNAPTTNAS
jgi:hypothetical protein